MSGPEALKSVQYVTVNGQQLAVLHMKEWKALVAWLETVEDLQIAKSAYSDLKKAKGKRAKAGWLKWDEVKKELA